MKLKNSLAKIQSFLSISKSELTVSILILFGLVIGSLIKFIFKSDLTTYKPIENYRYAEFILDSISNIDNLTNIGSDSNNEPMMELKLSDTVSNKKDFFPHSIKKELPKAKININTATIKELSNLPGIGPAMAEKIIEFRKNNKFVSIENLKEVKGIGEKKYEKLKPYISTK